MAYDRQRAQQQIWRGVVCSSPSTHTGRDLLHLEDSDLTCYTAENREGLHQDVTVTEGTEILLPCGTLRQGNTPRQEGATFHLLHYTNITFVCNNLHFRSII